MICINILNINYIGKWKFSIFLVFFTFLEDTLNVQGFKITGLNWPIEIQLCYHLVTAIQDVLSKNIIFLRNRKTKKYMYCFILNIFSLKRKVAEKK